MDHNQFWVAIWRTVGVVVVSLTLVATIAYNLGKVKELEYLSKGGSATELMCSQSATNPTSQTFCLEVERIKAAKQ